MSRLDNLCKVPEINLEQLTRVLYSQRTLHSLISLLPEDDCDKLSREMRKLNWQNPSGMQTFSLFKEVIEMERNILESCKA